MMGLGKRVAALERRMTLQAKTIKLLCDALERGRKEVAIRDSIVRYMSPPLWPPYVIKINGEKRACVE